MFLENAFNGARWSWENRAIRVFWLVRLSTTLKPEKKKNANTYSCERLVNFYTRRKGTGAFVRPTYPNGEQASFTRVSIYECTRGRHFKTTECSAAPRHGSETELRSFFGTRERVPWFPGGPTCSKKSGVLYFSVKHSREANRCDLYGESSAICRGRKYV